MSLRLEMLQVARLAPTILGEEASGLIADFVLSQEHADGGFCDRDGNPDLYYTSFAIDALTALQRELPQEGLKVFLKRRLESIDELDFVHLCCLARSASALTVSLSKEALSPVFDSIETYRTPDGGYNQSPDNETGSAVSLPTALIRIIDSQFLMKRLLLVVLILCNRVMVPGRMMSSCPFLIFPLRPLR